MAKRFMAWVIVTGATPTAFRSRYREDLLPTLKQLQRKQPDARLVWFERNRFWDSPEAARLALEEKRRHQEGRGPGWRPGGSHEDPRAKYQVTRDEKRARFKARMIRDAAEGRAPRDDRPGRQESRDDKPRAPGRPGRPDQRPGRRPGRGPGGKPGGDRPWGGKPGGKPGARRPGGGKPWGGKPGGGKPSGGKPASGKPGGGRPSGSSWGRPGRPPGSKSGGAPGRRPGGRPGQKPGGRKK